MKQLAVLSGKGGTGKTTVAAALAHLASRESRIVMADADVDAANLELLLSPTRLETHEFVGGRVAVIDGEACTDCGMCQAVCRFGAVMPAGEGFQIDPIACEGCSACLYRCPAQAIRMEDQVAGSWFVSGTRFGPLVHAHLLAAQENSGKLVTAVKQRARELAQEEGRDYLIVDGPPGMGCAVIATCSGAGLALLVTEPTVAGVHDLERILATTSHFGVRSLVAINKWDLNPSRADEIERLCNLRGVPVVGRIPFDSSVTASMVRGLAVTEQLEGHLRDELARIWEKLRTELDDSKQE